MRFIFCLILVCHFVLFTHAQGRKPELVTGDFRGIGITEFVRQIEARTSYRFYSDPAIFDLIVINAEIKDLPLNESLEKIFSNSQYSFSIDQNRVFLLKGIIIKK